jgi:hypothetical protein
MKTIHTFAVLCTVAVLPAQNEMVVPANASSADANASSAFPFGYQSMHMQQVWDGGVICTTQAAILGMTVRVNRADAGIAQAFTAQNMRVLLGHTSVTPATMSTTFASNVTGPMTTVFQGNMNVPAQQPPVGKAAPFNLPLFALTAPFMYTRAGGDLILEMISDPPNGKPSYFVDAATSGGNLVQWGTPGRLASDNLNFHAISRANQAIPGGTVDLSTETTVKSYPGGLLFGLTDQSIGGLPLPFDLGFFGATGNWLYLAPIATAPHNFQQTSMGWASTLALPVPNLPTLVGGRIYAQSYLVDPPANNAGLVTTDAIEATIGSLVPLPMAMVGHFDITRATGSFQFGSGRGGAVVKFSGFFQ